MTSKGKKLVAVRGDLLAKVVRIANRQGKTLFAFTNELLEQAIKADEMRSTLPTIVDSYELIKMEKETGSIIVPAEILSFLVEKLYPLEKNTLKEKWYKSGEWYGKYLLAKFPNRDFLEVLRKSLITCAWGVTDIDLFREGNSIKLRCATPYFPLEGTELFSKFLEGLMSAIGFKTSSKDYRKGMILMDFAQKTKPKKKRS
jgi:hypothetical protein